MGSDAFLVMLIWIECFLFWLRNNLWQLACFWVSVFLDIVLVLHSIWCIYHYPCRDMYKHFVQRSAWLFVLGLKSITQNSSKRYLSGSTGSRLSRAETKSWRKVKQTRVTSKITCTRVAVVFLQGVFFVLITNYLLYMMHNTMYSGCTSTQKMHGQCITSWTPCEFVYFAV